MTRPRFQLHALLTAGQFLTQVPLPGGMSKPGAPIELLGASVAYFPLVGALIGLSTGCVIRVASGVWGVEIAVICGLIAEALLTGAFHEDAVADSCDAFGGGYTRDDILRIMKDSRVGSYGALGLGLLVALRGVALARVPLGEVVLAAAAAGGLGRLGVVALMALVPPVPAREGSSKDVGRSARGTVLVVAAGWGLLALALGCAAGPGRTLAGCLGAAVLLGIWGWYVRRKLGGVTGDCLGCGAYLAQLAVTLAFAAGR